MRPSALGVSPVQGDLGTRRRPPNCNRRRTGGTGMDVVGGSLDDGVEHYRYPISDYLVRSALHWLG